MLTRSRTGKKVLRNRSLDSNNPFIYSKIGKKKKSSENISSKDLSFSEDNDESLMAEDESSVSLTDCFEDKSDLLSGVNNTESSLVESCENSFVKCETIVEDENSIICESKNEEDNMTSDDSLPKTKTNVQINIIKAHRDPILFSFSNVITDMPVLAKQDSLQDAKDKIIDDIEKIKANEKINSKFMKNISVQERLQVLAKNKKDSKNINLNNDEKNIISNLVKKEIDNIKEKLFIQDDVIIKKEIDNIKERLFIQEDVNIKKNKEKKEKNKGKPCHGPGCKNYSTSQSIYCGTECIHAHAKFSIKQLQNNRSMNQSSLSERVVVFERSTNKILTGPAAPTTGSLATWLEKHPTFEVLLSSQTQHLPMKKVKDVKPAEKKPMQSFIEPIIKEIIEKPVKVLDSQPIKKTEIKGPNPIRISVRNAIREILNKRANNCDDVMVSSNEVKLLAMDIEEEIFLFIQEINSKYKAKLKSILTHLRDPNNQGLFRRVLFGELKPSELVRLTDESMASKVYSQWNPVDLLEDDEPRLGAVKSLKERSDHQIDYLSFLTSDTTPQHGNHFFDINCKICTGKIPETNVMPDYSNDSRSQLLDTLKNQSINFDILSPKFDEETKPSRNIFEKYSADNNNFSCSNVANKIENERKPALLPTPIVFNIPLPEIIDDDNGEEDVEAAVVWQGSLICADIPPVQVFATLVSGCLDPIHASNSFSLLQQEISSTIHMTGRLSPENISSYIDQLKKSGMTNREMSVVNFEPKDELAFPFYTKLYSYLCSKNRCGVANVTGIYVKGVYIMPLPSDVPVYPILLPFDGPGLPLDRSNTLLGIVIKYSQKVAHAHIKVSSSSSSTLAEGKVKIPAFKQLTNLKSQKASKQKEIYKNGSSVDAKESNYKDLIKVDEKGDAPYDPSDIVQDISPASPTTPLANKSQNNEFPMIEECKHIPLVVASTVYETKSEEPAASSVICNKLTIIKTINVNKSNPSVAITNEMTSPVNILPTNEIVNKSQIFVSNKTNVEPYNKTDKNISAQSSIIDELTFAISSTSDPDKHKKILEELTQQIQEQKDLLKKQQTISQFNFEDDAPVILPGVKIIPIDPVEEGDTNDLECNSDKFYSDNIPPVSGAIKSVMQNKMHVALQNDSDKNVTKDIVDNKKLVEPSSVYSTMSEKYSNNRILTFDKNIVSDSKAVISISETDANVHDKNITSVIKFTPSTNVAPTDVKTILELRKTRFSGIKPITFKKTDAINNKINKDLNSNINSIAIPTVTSGSNNLDNTKLPKCLTELLSGKSFETFRNIVDSVKKSENYSHAIISGQNIAANVSCASLNEILSTGQETTALLNVDGQYKFNDMGDVDYRITRPPINYLNNPPNISVERTKECPVKKILLATPSMPPMDEGANVANVNPPLTDQSSFIQNQDQQHRNFLLAPPRISQQTDVAKCDSDLPRFRRSNSEIKRERLLRGGQLRQSNFSINPPLKKSIKLHRRSLSKSRKRSRSRSRKKKKVPTATLR